MYQYTYTVSKTVTPDSIYTSGYSIPEGYTVIDFRPPTGTDKFIGFMGSAKANSVSQNAPILHVFHDFEPRLILKESKYVTVITVEGEYHEGNQVSILLGGEGGRKYPKVISIISKEIRG